MKKIVFIALMLIGVTANSQELHKYKGVFNVTDTNTVFGQFLTAGTVVFDTLSGSFWQLDSNSFSVDSLAGVGKVKLNEGGNSIYSGSGTVPTSVVATLTDDLTFDSNLLRLDKTDGYISINAGSRALTENMSVNGQAFFRGGGVLMSSDNGVTGTFADINSSLASTGAVFNFFAGANTNTVNFKIGNNTDTTLFIATSDGGKGRVGINTLSPNASYSLDVTGGFKLVGNGSTSSTTALIISDTSANDIFEVLDDGSTIVGVGSTEASAQMQVNSTTKGFLPPRMTTVQMQAVTSPANGLLVFDSDENRLAEYDGAEWNYLRRGVNGTTYITSSAATTISTVNTPVKAAGTTATEILEKFDDDGGTNNRLRFTGAENRTFTVNLSASISSAANNKTYSIYIYKYDDSGASGAVIASSRIQRKINTGTDIGALSVTCLVQLDENDYIEVWVENNTDTTNPTFEFMNLSIK